MPGYHVHASSGGDDDTNPSAAGYWEFGTDQQPNRPVRVNSDGTISFGPANGSIAPDTVLARSAPGALTINGDAIVGGTGPQTINGDLTVIGSIVQQDSGGDVVSFAVTVLANAAQFAGLLTAAAGLRLSANTGDLTVQDGSGGIVGKTKPRVNAPVFNAGGTTTPNAAVCDICSIVMTGNTTFGAPTDANVVQGQQLLMRIRQDGSGLRTASWNAIYRFPGGQVPILSSGANKTDYLMFAYNITDTKWDLLWASQNL